MGIVADYRLAALVRVHAFCLADPVPSPLVSPPAGFAAQVAALAQRIGQIRDFMSEQAAGRRVMQHATLERAHLRVALCTQHLLPLRHAARTIERANPGVTVQVSVPPAKAREAVLLQVARAAATELAKPEVATLFADLLGPDFLDGLAAAIQVLDAASRTNDDGRHRQITATVGIERALAEGRRIVEYLRVLVRSACFTAAKTDPVAAAQALRNFAVAARVEQHVVVKRTPEPATTGSDVATTAMGHPSPVVHLAAA